MVVAGLFKGTPYSFCIVEYSPNAGTVYGVVVHLAVPLESPGFRVPALGRFTVWGDCSRVYTSDGRLFRLQGYSSLPPPLSTNAAVRSYILPELNAPKLKSPNALNHQLAPLNLEFVMSTQSYYCIEKGGATHQKARSTWPLTRRPAPTARTATTAT